MALNVRDAEALVAAALVAGLSVLPDLDLDIMLRHRGATHSLLAGLLVGLATGLLFANYFGFPSAFLIGFGGVALHLAGDVLTSSPLSPLWPFSKRKVALRAFRSDSRGVNRALLIMGASVAALYLLHA